MARIPSTSFRVPFHSNKRKRQQKRRNYGKILAVLLFIALRGYQDGIMLSGRVYIDETYFPVYPSDFVHNTDGSRLRGLSRNSISVSCATGGVHKILIATGRGKPDAERTWLAYGSHILPGSTIVHDGENSHSVLLKRIPGLREEIHTTEETRGLPDRKNPMDPINDFHRLAKLFMRAHGAYSREHIQNWLNVFSMMSNPPFDRKAKIRELLKRVMETRIRLKYRDFYKKKHL